MSLLRLNSLSIAFGHHAILDDVNLSLSAGERVCIVGRNGEGKSTLLKIIMGQIKPDDGQIENPNTATLGYLQQVLPDRTEQTVYDFVAEGLGDIGQVLKRYHELSQLAPEQLDTPLLEEMMALQQQLDQNQGWTLNNTVDTVLTQLDLDPEQPLSSLSGGWCRRATLARALLFSPDILLLDEPTNHLDIEMIQWLESFLLKYTGCIVFVSHDRAFIESLATRIVELDRGKLSNWPGDYQQYLTRKAEALEVEARQAALFDKKLSQEETWIRQGIKARRTRNEGRVRALQALREERAQRRDRKGRADFSIDEAQKSGKLVAKLEHVGHCFAEKTILNDFSTIIMRGDRIGLIGPNGVGKTTLLKIITGQLQPDAGQVTLGTNLSVAYFSQTRHELDGERSVADTVADGQHEFEVGGKPRHVMSYLRDFLFSPERARSPVKTLSGGECNRLLLAKLFVKPSNLIIMDEPTNDLDIETLELLEERLIDYQGTLLIVSHDRAFLDNVITSTIVFEGEGKLSTHIGGYTDWLRYHEKHQAQHVKPVEAKVPTQPTHNASALSQADRKALNALPKKVERVEAALANINEDIAAPDFYQQEQTAIDDKLQTLQQLEAELEELFEQWETLEAKRHE